MNKRQRKKRQKEQKKVLQTEHQTQQQMKQQTDQQQMPQQFQQETKQQMQQQTKQHKKYPDDIQIVDLAYQDITAEGIVEIGQDGATNETVKTGRDVSIKGTDETKELLSMLFPAFVLFFFEIVTEISCGNDIFNHHLVYIALFSISYGLLFCFICILSKKRRIQHIIQAVLLFLLGIKNRMK